MTARDIQRKLVADLFAQSFVLPNYTPEGWWENDLFRLNESDLWYEYEIKLTRGDFRADAAKAAGEKMTRMPDGTWGPRGGTMTKHQHLAAGSIIGPSRFYFVAPADVIPTAEIPEWAGMMLAVESQGYPYLTVVKKAPQLHRQKAGHLREHAQSVCYYRMHHLFLKDKNATLP